MAQILIVQGGSTQAVEAVFSRALSLFATLAGTRPVDTLHLRYAAVAKFPRLHGASSGIGRDESGQWYCTAGHWLSQCSSAKGALAQALSRKEGESLVGTALDIDGTFCAALGGPEGRDIHLITDRLGRLHVYRAETGGCRVLCTSSLIIAALVVPEWDRAGVREFLATGYLFGSKTLFEGITKLQPASVFTYRAGCAEKTNGYWRLRRVMFDDGLTRSGVPALAQALESVVAGVFREHRHPLLDLTGGFDSRIMLGVALRVSPEGRFSTVVNGGAKDADVLAAQRIAECFGLHHEHGMRGADWPGRWWSRARQSLALCDGEFDVLEYAGILDTHDALARRFDVSVNGSGGEICRGYWWELLVPHTGKRSGFDARRLAARRFGVDPWAEELLDSNEGTLTDHFTEVIEQALTDFGGSRNTACMDNIYLSLRMQRWQGRIASATCRIWACVSPFMFQEPMEAALSSPPHLRRRGRMARELVDYLDPALAALPMAGGYPASPIRWNTAHRFYPLAAEIAGKAWRKLARPSPAQTSRGPSVVGTLWRELEVQDLLDVPAMLTAPLYRRGALEGFLARSRLAGFGEQSHFGRILTLEMLARAVRRGTI